MDDNSTPTHQSQPMKPKMSIGLPPKPPGYPEQMDALALAEHVIASTPGHADEEFIEEFFRHAKATLCFVPIEEIKPGPTENNIRITAREKNYARQPASTVPPLVLENGHIQDGHHRYRAARSRGDKGLWCYCIEPSDR